MQNNAEKIVRWYIVKNGLAQIVSVIILLTISFTVYLAISNLYISLAAIIGFCSAIYVLQTMFAYKQIVKLNDILEKECDPETFTSVFQLLITKPIYRTRVTSASLNIAHGLAMQGKYQEAYSMLQGIIISAKPSIYRLQYYSIFANCAEARGDIGGVEWALSNMQNIVDSNKRSSKIVTYSNMAIQIINTILFEYNKKYDLAIEITTAYLNAAILPVQRVSAKSRLAKLYFYKEDYTTAKANCEYVIEHGNKLIHVVKAKELLIKCDVALSPSNRILYEGV